MRESRNAILNAEMVAALAPMVAAVVTVTQEARGGVLTVPMGDKPAVVRVELRASLPGLILDGGQPGQIVVLAVVQGAPGGFTWAKPANAVFAGGAPGPTSTTAGRRDIYTLVFDGAVWVETGRALNVY